MAVYRGGSQVTTVHDLTHGEVVFRAPGTPQGWFGSQLVVRKGDEMLIWDEVTRVPQRNRLPADLRCSADAPIHRDGRALVVVCGGGFAMIAHQREALSVIRYAVPEVEGVKVTTAGASRYLVTAQRATDSGWLGRMTVLVDFVAGRASVAERSTPFLSYDKVAGTSLWVKHTDCGSGSKPDPMACAVRVGELNDPDSDEQVDRRGTVHLTEHDDRFVIIDADGAWLYRATDRGVMGHVPGSMSSVRGSVDDEFRLVLEDLHTGRRVNFAADGTPYDVGAPPRALLHVATPDAMARLTGWSPEG